jgi:sulfide:quinone oxidoreductase
MDLRKLDETLTVSPQITLEQIPGLAEQGYRTLISNRPDGEEPGQPAAAALAAMAERHGMSFVHIPVVGGSIGDGDVEAFAKAVSAGRGAVHAFCRTGTRSATLWALSQAASRSTDELLDVASRAGYDLASLRPRLEQKAASKTFQNNRASAEHDVVIVGAGAAGLATAASLLRRRPGLKICIVDPAQEHYYQPGWTMVGAGVFTQDKTVRTMASLMPEGITWVQTAARSFDPERSTVELADGSRLRYRVLVAAPGLTLDWDAIPGLVDTLGRNGVTSNYRFDLAPYTWKLVQGLKRGRALFTQPPMPIKCAGAPQKAMYLSADHWHRQGRIDAIDTEFHTAGAVLFGVKDYVPALMEYVERYRAALKFESNLVSIDGPAAKATFAHKDAEGNRVEDVRDFDFIHVCPPQSAPPFIRASPLASATGWIDVDDATLRHKQFENVFGLGDACSAPNAKTAAAARKQAPVVAENVISTLDGRELLATYDGYGSCPLTVERGKIVLAEFGYGGKLLPSFPNWLIDGRKPSRLAWMLKSEALPMVYWNAMLKGREWLAAPAHRHPRVA